MSADEAVAVFHPAATAYLALFRHAGLRPGETVYVGGGAGNVGRAAIELAVLAGARVVTSARPEDADECASLGASAVVDYHDGAAAIAKAAPEGIDVYLDTSGHHEFDAALEVLARGGLIVLMAGNAPVPLPVGNLHRRDASILGFVLSDASVADLAAAADLINKRLAAGGLRPRIARTMSLAETAEAHRLVEAHEVRGRIVVEP